MGTETKERGAKNIVSEATHQAGYKSMIGTFQEELKWLNIIAIAVLHMISLWSIVKFPIVQNLRLAAWAVAFAYFNAFGVTGGVHRLWCHRSYKATLPLRILLMLAFTASGENSIFHWVRDHRVHHKFSETDADPHDIRRGFFFAHVGWLMMKKRPEVITRGKEVDMSDVVADPVVQFHEKFFAPLRIIFAFVVPTIIPPLWWGQDWFSSVMVMCTIRYCVVLNSTWSVNSVAHMWGEKPYDKTIYPVENWLVSILTSGEGWHNYHHTFPWDYKAAELGAYSTNFTTFWIDLFSKLGWAYDLRSPSQDLIKRVTESRKRSSHYERVQGEMSQSSNSLVKKG